MEMMATYAAGIILPASASCAAVPVACGGIPAARATFREIPHHDRPECAPSTAALLLGNRLRRTYLERREHLPAASAPLVSTRHSLTLNVGVGGGGGGEGEGEDGYSYSNGGRARLFSRGGAPRRRRRHFTEGCFPPCVSAPLFPSPCHLVGPRRSHCSVWKGSDAQPVVSVASNPRSVPTMSSSLLHESGKTSRRGAMIGGEALDSSNRLTSHSFGDNQGDSCESPASRCGLERKNSLQFVFSRCFSFSRSDGSRCSFSSSFRTSSLDPAPPLYSHRRRSFSRRPTFVREAAVSRQMPSLEEELRTEEESAQVLSSETYEIADGWNLHVEARRSPGGRYVVTVSQGEEEGVILHWAANDWQLPPQEMWTEDSHQADRDAVQTPFRRNDGDQGASWQVRLSVEEALAPQRLVFVLKKGEKWYNNGTFFTVDLKPIGLEQLVDKVIAAESTYSNWGLFNRFILAMEVLDGAESAGEDGMGFVFTWLRLSANRLLDWYRNSNYQTKDIAHVQKVMTTRMMMKARASADPGVRRFARMAMATLPRGGGDSEQIRMGILHIMRAHGIREGHRPGLHEPFLEQWHQKLHTNTSPEDITICEAYLHFLHTGSIDEFYSALWNKGGISREWLRSMDHPIRSDPVHLPHLIQPFQHFLWVLKTVHAGADLDVMVEMSKGFLDDDLKHTLYSILADRDAWWVPGKIVEARKKLESVWRSDWSSRDVLLLDIALEGYFSLHMSRIDKSSLSGDDLCELIALVLENGCIAAESSEIGHCYNYWVKVKSQHGRWSKEWAMLALAAVNRLSLGLQAFMDQIHNCVQPHAERFGLACNIQQSYVTNFGEEVVRGHPLFQLSIMLQRLEPMLRSTAGLSSWQVISQASAQGVVMVLPSLASVQGEVYDTPQIAVIKDLGGMEDIPIGVVGVLTSSTTDVLSHVAIRARNSKVLLATCFDADEFASICQMQGKPVLASGDSSGKVKVTEKEDVALGTADVMESSGNQSPASRQLEVPAVSKSQAWAITEEKFSSGVVGHKAGNIAKVRSRVPARIKLPPSAALPFGTFERVLADPVNAEVAARVSHKLEEVETRRRKSSALPAEQLEDVRKLVETRLLAPIGLREELAHAVVGAGLQVSEDRASSANGAWDSMWRAICKVWGSKWTSRAWLARRARGFPDKDLYMGCLLQKVIPAEYAFVIHTIDPTTKDANLMFCEVVPGLGEALVGNYPGCALSFTADKRSGSCHILSLPSKRFAFFAMEESLIVRSDSNGEDLEDFAGAGLYESEIVKPPQMQAIDYVDERLIWDPQFRDEITRGIAQVGKEMENAMGGTPQDIEGVFCNGEWTVVQVRPQVF
ncbi:hypothetical protein CBR_g12420 [Chara braunii]|uniref:Uncharacterized protein n=1 Tax=Chara braunii TaxID=69332 RepID=A0A388JS92_CHABU|nr:hypothetical protein CBR_g12420 [Chara braunii]|eukprot:GBG60684.1 hypothetical protein CBR_g12420 [Chara braunii]